VVQPRSGQPTRADIQRIAKEMGPLIPELLDMRAAVEPKAAELAARRASDEAIANLRWLAERAHRVRPADLRQADSTLHIAVAHTAQSARILDLVLEEQMRLHELLAYLSLAAKLREQQGHSWFQHDRIVETIADRDAAAAYEAMQDHIEATNAIIVELLNLDLDLEAVPTA
jgi:GntR family transcriptional regulator, transcriptional repressor for pyruvate dehydrogenase complex